MENVHGSLQYPHINVCTESFWLLLRGDKMAITDVPGSAKETTGRRRASSVAATGSFGPRRRSVTTSSRRCHRRRRRRRLIDSCQSRPLEIAARGARRGLSHATNS